MITCQNARDLFDRHMEGELCASLTAELHAHCLQCSSCQNELDMLQACGDVIALDRREPKLSADFTDRVLAARRDQLAETQARKNRWSRRLIYVGPPMAAAASILLAVLIALPIWQAPQSDHKDKIVGGKTVAQPKPLQDALGKQSGTAKSAEAIMELQATPEAPASNFVNAVVAPLVEQSRNTMESTMRHAEELKHWFGSGLAGPNSELYERWQAAQGDNTAAPAEPPAQPDDMEWWGSSFFDQIDQQVDENNWVPL